MNKTKPIRLGGGFLYVEMEEAEVPPLPTRRDSGKRSAADLEDTPDDAELVGFQEEVESLRSTIDALAADVAEAFKAAAPSEWSLEFNIGFKGKVSPIPVLVSGEGSTTLKVTAKWSRE